MTLTYGSLFSGIGGIDLGLDRAGMECKWQVEIDDYATRVLEKHWPDVPRYRDVRDVGAGNLVPVDLICGGFPCQDISNAGGRIGITGERSGLWSEYVRVVGELRPDYVLIENVAALLGRGIDTVLRGLAALGYDAEWTVLRTGLHLGHARARVFIVAYPDSAGLEGVGEYRAPTLAPPRILVQSTASGLPRAQPAPDFMRSVHGIPRRMDRIKCLGNAVVPQIAEWVGRCIIEDAGGNAT